MDTSASQAAASMMRPPDIMRPPSSCRQGCTEIIGSIAIVAIFLAISCASAVLAANIRPLGGVAIGGFALLLAIPLVPLALIIVSQTLVRGLNAIHKRANRALLEKFYNMAMFITVVGALCLAYYISHIICAKFSTLPKISYTDALKVLGHTTWMIVGLISIAAGIASYCEKWEKLKHKSAI